MAKLWPIYAQNDPEVGGFVIEFPSGKRKEVIWKRNAPVFETLDSAKALVTQLVQQCLQEGLIDDLDRTNIPSLVAAVQRLTIDFNERRRTALYAVSDAPPLQ